MNAKRINANDITAIKSTHSQVLNDVLSSALACLSETRTSNDVLSFRLAFGDVFLNGNRASMGRSALNAKLNEYDARKHMIDPLLAQMAVELEERHYA